MRLTRASELQRAASCPCAEQTSRTTSFAADHFRRWYAAIADVIVRKIQHLGLLVRTSSGAPHERSA